MNTLAPNYILTLVLTEFQLNGFLHFLSCFSITESYFLAETTISHRASVMGISMWHIIQLLSYWRGHGVLKEELQECDIELIDFCH